MSLAFTKKWPLYLSTKNTILKKYDGRWLLLYLCVGSYFQLLPSYAKLLFNSDFLFVAIGDDLQFEFITDLKTYFRRFTKKGGGKSLKNTQYGLF